MSTGCWRRCRDDDDGIELNTKALCHCLSVKPRGTKGPGWSLCFVRTQSIVNSLDAAADARCCRRLLELLQKVGGKDESFRRESPICSCDPNGCGRLQSPQ